MSKVGYLTTAEKYVYIHELLLDHAIAVLEGDAIDSRDLNVLKLAIEIACKIEPAKEEKGTKHPLADVDVDTLLRNAGAV